MNDEKLVLGYRKLLKTARQLLDEVEGKTGPVVEKTILRAQESLAAAGEYSREEIDKLGEYLKRDLHDAATYMEKNGRELGDWLRLDILKLETWLAESFLSIADRTRIELAEWAMRSELHTWHSGEICGPGVLQCTGCGEELHFTKPGHVPPCPKCHGSHFRRVID